MKKMITGGALAMVLALAGCGTKEADAMLKDLRGFKDKVCACKDLACAQKTSEEMLTWMSKQDQNTQGSESQKKEAEAIGKEIQSCMEKLATAGTPPAGGEAPTEAPK